MSYDGKILRRAKSRYEADRQQREEQLRRRRQEIYGKLPRIAQIDAQLRQTTPQIIAAAFRQKNDPSTALHAIRLENQRLQQEKKSLLLSAGYPETWLEDVPLCGQCGDNGWLSGGGMCGCLKRYYVQEQMRELSHLLDLGNQSFESFSFDWYSPEARYGQEISPRENMERNFEICFYYARRFGAKSGNLLFSGDPGLGKTFLSACIARTVSERGFSVVYDTAAQIFALFEAQKFGREDEASEEGVERILRCDLLIIDDLGTEMTTSFVQSALYRIINERLMTRKSTLINTNLPPQEIGRRYSVQILSRIEGEYQILPFFGDDIRRLKKQR